MLCDAIEEAPSGCAIGGPGAPYDVDWRDLDGVECGSLWDDKEDHGWDGISVSDQDLQGLYIRVDFAEPTYVNRVSERPDRLVQQAAA